jgi:acyl-CoA synthetase (AMP-forming)/AMP-acid ligase II
MAATLRPSASPNRSTIDTPRAIEPRRIVDCILANVRRHPERPAIVVAGAGSNEVVSFGALGELIDGFAAGLDRSGIGVESRVLLMAAPSLRFYALALGVLASGRMLVVVDGRMRPRRILHALKLAAPDVVVAAPTVMRWWPLVAPLRRARRFTIDGTVFGSAPVETLWSNDPASAADLSPDKTAILAFSSGSTGHPKQIGRSHSVLLAQHRALAAAFPPPAGDVNLAGFPMAVLHNLCCGTTTVLPDAALRAEMGRDPEAAFRVIERSGVTSLSAAPAFVRALSRYATATSGRLERVTHVVVGGGPVSRAICADVMAAFPNAQASVVYGATEAEPIATVSMREVLASEGEGFLVGRLVPEVEMLLDHTCTGRADAGEVLVRGAHVVRPTATSDDWHRTSDVARIDTHGRLWLLGRVGDGVLHRGQLVWPGAVEAHALKVPGVDAAGFVAHARAAEGELAIAVTGGVSRTDAATRVRAALAERRLDSVAVRVVDRIPMDARHDSKVSRRELAKMLERGGE